MLKCKAHLSKIIRSHLFLVMTPFLHDFRPFNLQCLNLVNYCYTCTIFKQRLVLDGDYHYLLIL